MTDLPETSRPSYPLLKLMIVEDDPVFRLGLLTCLNQFPDLQVIAEADSVVATLETLQRFARQEPPEHPDLIVLNLELKQGQGLALCQQLKANEPTLPLLLLGSQPDPDVLAAAYQAGADGYGMKGAAITELVHLIRAVAAGQSSWAQGREILSAVSPVSPPAVPAAPRRFASMRQHLRQSGLRQIDAAIAALNEQLRNPDLSSLDQLVLTGRRRELRAARWLISRLLQGAAPPEPELASTVTIPQPEPSADQPALTIAPTSLPGALAQPRPGMDSRTLQAVLFDATAAKLQSSLLNLTTSPLEIDILRPDQRRELLYTILRQIEMVLADLRFSQVELEQLGLKRAAIVQDLWQQATTEFLGKYYTLILSDRPIEVVPILLNDVNIVQREILDSIPQVPELFSHLLFQTPLRVDDTSCAAGSIEAMMRAEALLQNLMIQVANAVMQPLLNRFGDVVEIRQTLYDKRLMSTREIERFRNNLSWKYRMQTYFGEPTAIFESRYTLFSLQERGIVRQAIYAPRRDELDALSGVQFAVTLALEARDAIAPRLRSTVAFVGSGVVYLLTEVIGRGIGLIGRGIIKGIGNALQDPKWTRNSSRSR